MKSKPSGISEIWNALFSGTLPRFLKTTYAPRESWKHTLFTQQDCDFFYRGVEELSSLFTSQRSTKIPPYFQQPKFRSAYLLYFFPLQSAKFLTLFQKNKTALQNLFKLGQSQTLVIADLGCGPASGSFALIIYFLNLMHQNTPPGNTKPNLTGLIFPKVKFFWADTQPSILKDARALLETFIKNYPELQGKIQIVTFQAPWRMMIQSLPRPTHFIFLGNVLNEDRYSGESNSITHAMKELYLRSGDCKHSAGILILEPAQKRASQNLSALREVLLEKNIIPHETSALWGPCLHAKRCPFILGKDWCHFSDPMLETGQWFDRVSQRLGSKRKWIKYSYLWLAALSAPSSRNIKVNQKLVLSDPFPHRGKPHVLICEPERARRWPIAQLKNPSPKRGDVIDG